MYTRGVGLSTHSDSELITQTLCLDPPGGQGMRPDWPARITHLMELTPLAYSLVIMDNDRIYGVRDPYGNRPLCLGKVVPDGERLSDLCFLRAMQCEEWDNVTCSGGRSGDDSQALDPPLGLALTD